MASKPRGRVYKSVDSLVRYTLGKRFYEAWRRYRQERLDEEAYRIVHQLGMLRPVRVGGRLCCRICRRPWGRPHRHAKGCLFIAAFGFPLKRPEA